MRADCTSGVPPTTGVPAGRPSSLGGDRPDLPDHRRGRHQVGEPVAIEAGQTEERVVVADRAGVTVVRHPVQDDRVVAWPGTRRSASGSASPWARGTSRYGTISPGRWPRSQWMWAAGSLPDSDGIPPEIWIHFRSLRGSYPWTRSGPPTYRLIASAPRESIQVIALASGSPRSSTATVPDHCDVTEIAASRSGMAPRPRSRATHARIPSHQRSGVLLGTTVVGQEEGYRLELAVEERSVDGERRHLRTGRAQVDRQDDVVVGLVPLSMVGAVRALRSRGPVHRSDPNPGRTGGVPVWSFVLFHSISGVTLGWVARVSRRGAGRTGERRSGGGPRCSTGAAAS